MFVFKKYDRQNHVWSFMTKYLRFLCFTSWSCGCIEKQIRCWKNCWYSYNIDKCNKILCLSSRNIMLWKKPSWVAIVKKIWLWSSSVIKIVKIIYNRIDIKWGTVSISSKIYLDILSYLYITFTILYYNTISLKCTFLPVLVKGLYQTESYSLHVMQLYTAHAQQRTTFVNCFSSSMIMRFPKINSTVCAIFIYLFIYLCFGVSVSTVDRVLNLTWVDLITFHLNCTWTVVVVW